jgi:thioredoxin 1
MVGPIIDELHGIRRKSCRKVDVDANQEFAAKYVRNIPTVLIFHNGEVVGKQVGVALPNVR